MHHRFMRWLVALAKNSPWLMIAVGLHLILALVMSIVVIRHELAKKDASATSIEVRAHREAEPEVVLPPETIDRKKIPDNAKAAELVDYTEETTFVPTEEEPVAEDLSVDIGDPTGSVDESDGATGGTSIGVGAGGHYGTGRASGILSRRPGGGSGFKQGRRPEGSTVGTEESVLEGLRWLMRHQNEDGSWGADTVTSHCTAGQPCIPPDAQQDAVYNVGMTSLSLLAFLGQGIKPGDSKISIVDQVRAKRHNAGDVVKRGIRWLMDRQKEDGSFSDSEPFEYPENESLSAMALCEAYGLSNNREIRRPAQKALDFLIAAQRRNADGARTGWGLGSWADIEARFARGELEQAEYEQARSAVDLSVTCWVVMALRSAQTCGFEVPDEVLQGALAYAEVAAPQALQGDGSAGETQPHDAARRAALGMLIRCFAGREVTDEFYASAAQVIAKDLPEAGKDGLGVDFYYWYFATLALYQYDGPDSPRPKKGDQWEPWNKALVHELLPLQEEGKAKDACARGGWLSAARGNQRGRALYNTALNVLTLEVYYRFGNVFGLK